MLRKPFRYFAVLALSPLLFLVPRVISKPDPQITPEQTAPQLTAHEWGTFTSVAGRDGAAVDWLPLTGSVDLPKFIERLGPIAFKTGLRGTVRMETPVLYFYSPQETSVSVKVGISKGVITEWYPHADHPQSPEAVMNANLKQQHPDGGISWNSVLVEPAAAAEFPSDSRDDRYYSARETSANPLLIKTSTGAQHEKFLFYRGVASFRVPLLAQAGADNVVQFETLGSDPIPAAILFERRGTRIGYRLLSPVPHQAEVNSPELSSSTDSLAADLEKLLVAQGLFQDEARAMVKTWQDSWFEEGSRLLYILPQPFVDSILPLSIQPAPAKISRVFVGRIELVTPATQRAIESALAKNDRATLARYGRFLEPILKTMKQTETDARKAALLQKELDAVTNAEAALEVAGRN